MPGTVPPESMAFSCSGVSRRRVPSGRSPGSLPRFSRLQGFQLILVLRDLLADLGNLLVNALDFVLSHFNHSFSYKSALPVHQAVALDALVGQGITLDLAGVARNYPPRCRPGCRPCRPQGPHGRRCHPGPNRRRWRRRGQYWRNHARPIVRETGTTGCPGTDRRKRGSDSPIWP